MYSYTFRAATDHFLRLCSYTYSAVFEQNIASARRPSFVRYHVISGGIKGGGGRPLLAHIVFPKSRFLRVKDIYFVVRICDT